MKKNPQQFPTIPRSDGARNVRNEEIKYFPPTLKKKINQNEHFFEMLGRFDDFQIGNSLKTTDLLDFPLHCLYKHKGKSSKSVVLSEFPIRIFKPT